MSPRPSVPKKKAAAVRRTKAAPAPSAVSAPKKSGAAVLLLALVLIAALVGQAGWVFYRDRKAQVTLHYDGAVAPRGPGKGQVTGCRAMAADAKSNLYYLEGVGPGSVLQKFARDGQWLAWVSPDSKPAERLNNGWAVAPGQDGSVWVVERGGALKQYGPDLALMRTVALPGSDSSGVAVAPDGSVWVANYQGQLLVLPAGGSEAKPFDGPGKSHLKAPYRLCFDPQGRLYVLDFENGIGQDPLVKSFDAKGAFLRAWTVKDDPINEFACIAWHPLGYVVVNDSRGEVVDAKGFRLYSPEGRLQGLATLTDTGQNLRAIPGFCISPSGDWFMDLTPLQQGCGRLTWAPAP